MKEIYWNQAATMLVVEELNKGEVKRLDEMPGEFIQRMDAAVADIRPVAYEKLCDEFGHGPKHAYARVFQFSACNFSVQDGRPDIDDDFTIITERVPCPVRHKCNLPYCTFESQLSKREIEIVKLFAQGFNENSIADQLFISPATVHNHITNIYKKLGLTGSDHPDRLLVSFAYNNKLIK
jgi:hypothetical protein